MGFNNQNSKISDFFDELIANSPLRVSHQKWNSPSYEFAITHKDSPTFDTWVWQMNNEQKLDWIKSCGLYVVLWLQISRVADYYFYHYNHWKPRGNTGYLDADFRVEPDENWKRYENIICSSVQSRNFVLASTELLGTRVPFLLEEGYDEIPEDDPRWDDDNFTPPLVPTHICTCMFGE